MGDHTNGPTKFAVDVQALSWLNEPEFLEANSDQEVCLSSLLHLNSDKFLGPGYAEKYPHAGQDMAFLFKVLSVRTALSI